MTNYQQIFAMLGPVLLVAVSVLSFPILRKAALRWQCLLLVVVAVLTLAPIFEKPLYYFIRGLLGDLSITTLFVMTAGLLSIMRRRDVLPRAAYRQAFPILIGLAVLLYPTALGWTELDLYTLGYLTRTSVVVLFLVALILWGLRLNFALGVLLLAMLAHQIHLLESRNLWDYLIDPVIAIHAVVWMSREFFRNKKDSK